MCPPRHSRGLSIFRRLELPPRIPGRLRPLVQLWSWSDSIRDIYDILKFDPKNSTVFPPRKIPAVWRATKSATVKVIVRQSDIIVVVVLLNGLVVIVVVVVVVARLPIAITAQPIMNLNSFQHHSRARGVRFSERRRRLLTTKTKTRLIFLSCWPIARVLPKWQHNTTESVAQQ